MFKVLVIAYYYPPMGLSGVQRTLKFTKYMKEFDWEPTVITAGRTGYYAHDLSLLKEVEKYGINVIRTDAKDINSKLALWGTVKMPREFIRKILSYISKLIFIPDNKISWAKKAFVVASEELSKNNYDAIFVTIPPFSSFPEAVKLKEKFNIPLFVDYRDLWVGNQFNLAPTPYHKYKHKKLEYQSLRMADKVITENRKTKENILTKYPFLSFEDIVILPHGFDPDDFDKNPSVKREKYKLVITYTGIFYEKITPKYFLQAFKKLLLERPDIARYIELHFIGHFRKENHKLVRKLKIQEYVKDFGYLNHSDTIVKMNSSDILWMMVGKGENYSTVSTGKLLEYFGTRKPIIACVPDGAAKDAAKQYGASFITEPDDVQGIKQIFIDIYNLYKSNKLPVPNEDFVAQHNRKMLAEKLTKEFQFKLKEIV
ncbi:MAG: glycosyl transferase family 1 [Melioribacteraceae bacterium]|nr:glycosyl transferase family 1 [Melioribacteraceae bacterium]